MKDKSIKDAIMREYTGANNAGNVMILTGKINYTKIDESISCEYCGTHASNQVDVRCVNCGAPLRK